MNWYYASGSEQKGPVGQSELDRLVQVGAITPATLVWREGMTDWLPYGQVMPVSTVPPPPLVGVPGMMATPVSGGAGVVCTQCGRIFPPDQVIRLGAGFVCASCKPVAMQKLREGVPDTDAELTRKEHIKHEASIKSVGILYFLSSVAIIFFGIAMAGRGGTRGAVIGTFVLLLGIGQFFVGLGLRRLKSWARILSGILSGIGLLGFPFGTLINVYILYLLFSRKGSTIFSEDYQRVIEATPHIKYRTSIVVWILVALVVLALVAALLVPILARHRM